MIEALIASAVIVVMLASMGTVFLKGCRVFVCFLATWYAYTVWCAVFGPPYNDAYGLLIHAAFKMFVA